MNMESAELNKEFDIFKMIKGETLKEVIDRYCRLIVQMRKHDIKKTDEEQIDKLADALPEKEWSTYVMKLKNSPGWMHYKLSSFIDKIEEHEDELRKKSGRVCPAIDVDNYRADNVKLFNKIESLTLENKKLKENEKNFENKIKNLENEKLQIVVDFQKEIKMFKNEKKCFLKN